MIAGVIFKDTVLNTTSVETLSKGIQRRIVLHSFKVHVLITIRQMRLINVSSIFKDEQVFSRNMKCKLEEIFHSMTTMHMYNVYLKLEGPILFGKKICSA